jgi:hypothetical protein
MKTHSPKSRGHGGGEYAAAQNGEQARTFVVAGKRRRVSSEADDAPGQPNAERDPDSPGRPKPDKKAPGKRPQGRPPVPQKLPGR